MAESEEGLDATRLNMLKKAFKRIVAKRELSVIDGLVNAYRDGELTQEKAYAAIMVIAELRSARNDVGNEDLQ